MGCGNWLWQKVVSSRSQLLQYQIFFDTSSFRHAALFKEGEYVWEALKRIHFYLEQIPLGAIEGEVDPGAFLVDPERISIGKGSIVEPGAYIRGPCVIGENCVIRHGAYIRGDFIAGDRCVIGHDTEIKNAIFLNHAQAAHFAYIGDSILGNHVNLGAGAKCANLRLDHKNIFVDCEGIKIDSGLKKFGAVLGDFSQLGCNCVANPGTFLGKNSVCHPCLNVGGIIPEKHVVKSMSRVIMLPTITQNSG